MRDCKIVFTGTPGAGKTTAIAAISDTPPVVTDVPNRDPSLAKARTTVGMDYGEVLIADLVRVRLFGTPGQTRFDFLWPILAHKAMGLIILVDNSRPDPLADLRIYLDAFAEQLEHTACVIGIGRTEAHPEPGLQAFGDELARRGRVIPVLPVDVRERDGVLMLLDCILAQLEARNRAGRGLALMRQAGRQPR
ncbi:MAG: GTP-binding protein [Sphaerotilus natans subsp. sulfidivorans]|uniref:GTP-binding protein n=1 Tax=Sphaerotilus sulfidivorans TaxID=639200 RepID=UPI002354DF09|nr:GTP-binding protein [Sphaerotilus sulfidivorans]MCK6400570.1 GTP-binding protein [Sphaerotilus sulfidivorans]